VADALLKLIAIYIAGFAIGAALAEVSKIDGLPDASARRRAVYCSMSLLLGLGLLISLLL
jgi:hypothetical protein